MLFLRYRYIGGKQSRSPNKAGQGKNRNTNNQSVVKAAAYRSGEDLHREKTGEVAKYKNRANSILWTGIYGFSNAPRWTKDRQKLWNKVEAVETKKGSRQAREIVLAFPHEFDLETQKTMLADFISSNLTSRGMIADAAIHAPDKESDSRNYHAHILLTTRTIDQETSEFSNNKYGGRKWNDKALHKAWKTDWAVRVNRQFAEAGIDKEYDPATYRLIGVNKIPQKHEGRQANNQRRKGEETKLTKRNDLVAIANNKIETVRVCSDEEFLQSGDEAKAAYDAAIIDVIETLQEIHRLDNSNRRSVAPQPDEQNQTTEAAALEAIIADIEKTHGLEWLADIIEDYEKSSKRRRRPDKPDRQNDINDDTALGQSERSLLPTTSGSEQDAVQNTAELDAVATASTKLDNDPDLAEVVKPTDQPQQPKSDRPSSERAAIDIAYRETAKKPKPNQRKNPLKLYCSELVKIVDTSTPEIIANAYKNNDDFALECDRIIYSYMRSKGFTHEQIRKAMKRASPAMYRKSKVEADKYARRFNEWARKQQQKEEEHQRKKRRIRRRL